jgi:hypothetical protein
MFVRESAPIEPWTNLHMDHYGPLNRTPSPDGFRYILTVVCRDCHSPRFLPSRSNGAKETAARLLDVFGQESFPRLIVTDRHQAFMSELISELGRLTGFTISTTVSGRAQGNSPAERPHRFLGASLRALRNTDRTNWHEALSLISLSYRSVVAPHLGDSPFFLERGRQPRLPTEVPDAPTTEVVNKDARLFARSLESRIGNALATAARLDAEARRRSARYYDASRRDVTFQIGDLVWIFYDPPASTALDSTRRTRKLEDRVHGPWRITEALGPLHYRAQNTVNRAIDKFTVDQMIPAYVPDDADHESHTRDDDSDDSAADDDQADSDWEADSSVRGGGCNDPRPRHDPRPRRRRSQAA